MTTYDLVFNKGKIVDGCGNLWFYGDLAVHQGRIAVITPPGSLRTERVIDAGNRFVTPGFIDVHMIPRKSSRV